MGGPLYKAMSMSSKAGTAVPVPELCLCEDLFGLSTELFFLHIYIYIFNERARAREGKRERGSNRDLS